MPAEQVLARLAGADEHGQQLLPRRRREARLPGAASASPSRRRRSSPPAGRELLERNGRRIDERTRDRAAATRRDVEAERQVGRRARDRGRRSRLAVDQEPRRQRDARDVDRAGARVGQPLASGRRAAFAFTTAGRVRLACAEPSAFFAVTRTRSVLPRSAYLTMYVDLSAPPMLEQLLPLRVAAAPLVRVRDRGRAVPRAGRRSERLSLLGVPEIVGSPVLTGTARARCIWRSRRPRARSPPRQQAAAELS